MSPRSGWTSKPMRLLGRELRECASPGRVTLSIVKATSNSVRTEASSLASPASGVLGACGRDPQLVRVDMEYRVNKQIIFH